MALLNYTTRISVGQTLGEIQEMLAQAGAKKLQIDYQNGLPIGVTFLIETSFGDRGYDLTADVDAVYRVLCQEPVDGRYKRRDQAARTAWRIQKDWLEAQLAKISTGMATLELLMLPYMLMNREGETLFQVMTKHQLALPPGREE